MSPEMQITWIGIYLNLLATMTYIGAFVFLFYFLMKLNELITLKRSKIFLIIYIMNILGVGIIYTYTLITQLTIVENLTIEIILFVLSLLFLIAIPVLKLRTGDITYHFMYILMIPISVIISIHFALQGVINVSEVYKRAPIDTALFISLIIIYLFRQYFKSITPFKKFFKSLYRFYMTTLVILGVLHGLYPLISLIFISIAVLFTLLEPFFFYTASVTFFFNVLTVYKYYKEGKMIR